MERSMLKKLVLSFKVLFLLFFLFVVGLQAYFAFEGLDKVTAKDAIVYRMSQNIEEDVNIAEYVASPISTFENSVILADKKSSLKKFIRYNQDGAEKILIMLVALLLLLALEKWLFWLLKKD
jgi:hypothetical protein